MKFLRWLKANVRPDWKVFTAVMVPAWVLYFFAVNGVQDGSPLQVVLLVVFILYLLFGSEYVVDKYHAWKDRKTERKVEQVLRAEEFEDRLDKSFGLDSK